jgi:6-phosphofructokinase 1
LKTIGVVTSGGDAPGMNAAIRAVVRVASGHGIRVLGFRRGWGGVVANEFMELTPRSVSGIIQLGGTILHTSRCKECETAGEQKKASGNLKKNRVEGLVVIGGDGSMRGARAMSKASGIPMVGVPASIDNDVYGTDETIGFDTAVNTSVSEIDKIRDTAVSHDRIFIVEVMGRQRGFIAAMVGLTVGAEATLVPEVKYNEEVLLKLIRENEAKGKKSAIIVAAEGVGDTRKIAEDIEKGLGLEARLSIIGYAQRGGSPTARSRFLAAEFGNRAVELLLAGNGNRVVGVQNGKITDISLEESCNNKKPIDLSILQLAKALST